MNWEEAHDSAKRRCGRSDFTSTRDLRTARQRYVGRDAYVKVGEREVDAGMTR